jgi:serine/threonine protein kinase
MVFRWLGRKREKPPPGAEQPPDEAPDRVYCVGDVIGGDWLVRKVIEGGLGVVYVVEHRERDGTLCVLKAPKRQSDAIVRESFRTEAETWVRLGDHPNIVRALGVDEFAGQLFVVAELVEGDEHGRVSLRDYLRFGSLMPRPIGAWAADFCYGLVHAQSKGLVAHRDIKPENLLIGASGTLRITDFGIARAMALSVTNPRNPQTKLGTWETSDGEISGTPPYMAPEQWLGAKQDSRTDIYAFGITMHEMCYGRRPFLGPDIREQHLRIEPQIPSSIFAGIVARCLSKNPAARYSTPSALLDDITRVCRDGGIALPPKPKVASQKAKELDALAQGLGALGKIGEALAAARELAALEPEDAGNWTQLGRLLLETGDDKGAVTALERSLSLDETRSPTWNNFGIALKRQKKWQQAIFAFDRALDCDPSNTGAIMNCTEALLHLDQGGEAIVRLKRAAEIAPDKFGIWSNLGSAYISAGDKKRLPAISRG